MNQPEKTPRTYFGLEIVHDRFVRLDDIEQLPFAAFWHESARGSTCQATANGYLIFLHDWQAFCRLFIETGRHRFQKEE